MTTKKIMAFGISFVLATMLLSSGNALNLSFAQSNTIGQTNSVDQTNTGDQSTNDGGNDNSDRQNFEDFESCLEEEAGTQGFATEQQIRDCFAPIYIGSNNDDNNNNDDDNNNNDDDNNNN
jgi:hypothetical protein